MKRKLTTFLLTTLMTLTLSSCDLFNEKPITGTLTISNSLDISEVSIGDELVFSAKLDNKDIPNSDVRWSSTNETLASVDTYGNFIARAKGQVKVKAVLKENIKITAFYTVDILTKSQVVNGIEVISSNGTFLEVGEESNLTTKALPTYVDCEAVYTNSNNEVISLSEGKIKALQTGKSTIRATSVKNDKLIHELEIEVVNNKGFEKVDTSSKVSAQDLGTANGSGPLSANGDSKVLIVPVQMKEAQEWTPAMLVNLENAMFGKSEDTSWESVSSFYYKSSYGNLNINGEIADVFHVDKTVNELNAMNANYYSQTRHTVYIAEAFYDQADADLLKEYDTDGDGYVDAVYFIYSNPYDGVNFWAWVWWMKSYFTSNVNKPGINTHMWASYKFIQDGYGASGIDAHTFIHETGHILGLDDYYDYGSDSRAPLSPAGGVDMMDYNITDHSSYSKFALNWTKPYYVDGSLSTTKITINSFTDTGDFILLKSDWNRSALDEYILIELFTPTGLNEKDSLEPYPSSRLQGFNTPGIRIYHIDSRAGRFNYRGADYGFAEYTDNPIANGYYGIVGNSGL